MNDMDHEAILAREQAEARRAIEVEELREVLATPAGRRLAWRLLERTHLFHLSFRAASERETCLREGERAVGLWFLAEMNAAAPEAIALAMQDHRHRQEAVDASLTK